MPLYLKDKLVSGTGAPGRNGVTPTIGGNGNWYLGDVDTGKPSRGKTGPAGADGHAPVKGIDYFTESDKTELVNAVLTALPAAEGVSY